MDACFSGWRAACGAERVQQQRYTTDKKALDGARYRVALAVRDLIQARKHVKNKLSECQANRAKASFQQARHEGPRAMARLTASLLKGGRRYRPPATLPPLKDDQGRVIVDKSHIQDLLGDHFAKAEKATKTDVATHRQQVQQRPQQYHPPWSGAAVPSVAVLARAFKKIKNGKAPGPSGLVPEIFSQTAPEAAEALYPRYLKLFLRLESPFDWSRSLIRCLPKPSKSPCTPAGWRSIALQEVPAKAAALTVRQHLVDAFDKLAGKAQLGGRPGGPMLFPAMSVQCHLRAMKARNRSAGVVFVDGVQALYSVMRELVIGFTQDDSGERIVALVESLHEDEDIRSDLYKTFFGPSILETAGVPQEIQSYLRQSLSDTFFQLDINRSAIYKTYAGTLPGAPLADVMFQLAMIRFQAQLRQQLESEGLQVRARADVEGAAAASSVATWVDDLAIPTDADDPFQLVPKVVRVAQLVEKGLRATGVRVNFSEGKTEAVLCFRGKRSKAARHEWMVAQRGWAHIPGQRGEEGSKMRLTDHYVHLGSWVQADGAIAPDIRHRLSVAQPIFKAMRNKLLCNKHLQTHEKLRLVLQGPIASLLHGSGLWCLRRKDDFRAFNRAHMGIMRQCVRPLLGLSSRGLLDEEVCILLGVLAPEDALSFERTKAWISCARLLDVYEIDMLISEKTWLMHVLSDFKGFNVVAALQMCLPDTQDLRSIADFAAWTEAHRHTLRNALKRAVRCKTKQDEPTYARVMDKAQRLTEFFNRGGELWRMSAPDENSVGTVVCPDCSDVFRSQAAMAAHRSKSHGVKSLGSMLGDHTLCQRCRTDYWTPQRLWLHLRKQPACLHAFVAEDFDEAPSCVVRHKQPAQWPAAKVAGPVSLWSTMILHHAPNPVQPIISTMARIENVWQKFCKETKRSAKDLCQAWQGISLILSRESRPSDAVGMEACEDTELQAVLQACSGFPREVFGLKLLVRGEFAIVFPRKASQAASALPA